MSTAFQGDGFQGDGFQIGAPQTGGGGGGGITGDLSVTLGAVTSSSAGVLAIKGDASITLAAVTLSSTSALAIQAAASNTLGAVTLSAASTLAIQAAASNTLGAVTVASTGALALKADASITLGDVTLSAAGAAVAGIAGDADITLGAVTVSSDATLTPLAGTTRNDNWENTVGTPSWGGGKTGSSRWRGRRVYIYAEPEPVITTDAPPKRVKAKRKELTPALLEQAWASLFPTPLPQAVADAAPTYAYVQASLPQGDIIAAVAAFLHQQAMAEQDDEDDIEMLLLAA